MNSEFDKFLRMHSGDKRGAKSRVARLLGISPAHVTNILSGKTSLSPRLALLIENISGGAVSKEKLIWPENQENETAD